MSIDSENVEAGESQQDLVNPERQPDQAQGETPDLSNTRTLTGRIISGRILRFAGMFIVIAVAIFVVTVTADSKILASIGKELFGREPIGPLILIGLVGASMHFAGRQLAPGIDGASKRGGIVALIVLAGPIVFVWAVVIILSLMLDFVLAIFGL